MEDSFQQATDIIQQSNCILLTMHERMDGDDGGSVLAIAAQLEKMGKKTFCTIKHGVPPQLLFLPGSEKIYPTLQEKKIDLLVVCGCSTLDRTGIPEIINFQGPILNIDHHPDNTKYGTVNMVEPTKSSVAELVYDFFMWNKWDIDHDIATCLLTGIITDTGSFMHSNTQSSTLDVAAQLMRKGAQTSRIIHHTFKSKDVKTLRAWGKAIENSYFEKESKIIYSVLTEKDLQNFGQLPQSAFEGLTETLNKVPEAKFAMFIRQDGNTIKGSLRSEVYKNIDVSKIAKLFGGGGHKQAAGFSVVGKLMKNNHGQWKIV